MIENRKVLNTSDLDGFDKVNIHYFVHNVRYFDVIEALELCQIKC